ncbi:sodium/potassium-transporting ATPase subunit beta-2-like [Athalia rosae]|uniref:sodium/potassium-transporting ATPase subunit beta-2-like n=1 Tax=Athalia rosae TaxID=37344 RepID=UPI0020348796|nr:sodium/potassium-transporting ATPase subunit beta-2-like [Athalia rosae]
MSIPGKRVEDCHYEFEDSTRGPPKILGKWEALRLAVYDGSTGKFLGRTRSSWGVVGLFYLVFFSVLAVFCAICFEGLMLTINLQRPKWILEESIIGTSPGLGFRPISDNTNEKSLIWYNATNQTEVAIWTQRIDQFLNVYQNTSLFPDQGQHRQDCSDTELPEPGKVCAFNFTDWDVCAPGGSYGYNDSTPCFFIKLNRIYGWTPDYYTNDETLPEDMPRSLKDHIKSINGSSLNSVWITCSGQNPADREVIGDIEYFPKNGRLPGYYYPYTNIPGYLSPLVAVHFPKAAKNIIINVECRAWAKNIRYNGVSLTREGSVHFAFMIDY